MAETFVDSTGVVRDRRGVKIVSGPADGNRDAVGIVPVDGGDRGGFVASEPYQDSAGVWRDPLPGFVLPAGQTSYVDAAGARRDGLRIDIDLAAEVSTFATDASETPTTTRVTLAGAQNAVRLFVGDIPRAEPRCFVWIRKNGGAAIKMETHRFATPIIRGDAGDTFAFGTIDGRTLMAAPMTVPDSLLASFPVSGSANVDKAGPPLWTPSAPHITLPGYNLAIRIQPPADLKGLVFVAERDPAGVWTRPKAVPLQPGRPTVVQCTYAEIALASYTGAAVTVDAPAGSTIGGTSGAMALSTPAYGGTVRTVSTVAGALTAFAAAVAGDRILFEPGTYAFDRIVQASLFTANGNSLNGLYFGSTTGNRADVILTGDAGAAGNGRWSLAGGSNAGNAVMLADVTFNFAGLAGLFCHFASGHFFARNVLWTGATSDVQDQVLFTNSTAPLVLDMLDCRATVSAGDCYNGNGTAGNNAATRIRLINCEGITAGPGTSDQCLTSHTGLPVEVWGGLYQDAVTNVITPDSTATPMYVFGARLERGARAAGHGNTMLDMCYSEGFSATNGGPYAVRNRARFPGATSTAACLRNVTTQHIRGNWFEAINSMGRGLHNSPNSGTIDSPARSNGFKGFTQGCRLADGTSSTATSVIKHSAFIDCGTGLEWTDASMSFTGRNLAVQNATTGINLPTGVGVRCNLDWSTIDPTIDADLVPGANVTQANAALDAYGFPTEGGNCDGNGDPAEFDFDVGGSDPWGFPLKYLATRASRGFRERPAIYANAVLFPDQY